MENIKRIIQTLVGEDITEENLERLSLLTSQLSAALQEMRTKVLLKDAQIAVVLPKNFGEKTESSVPTSAPIKEKISPTPFTGFSVPRPPSIIKVKEEETIKPEEPAPIGLMRPVDEMGKIEAELADIEVHQVPELDEDIMYNAQETEVINEIAEEAEEEPIIEAASKFEEDDWAKEENTEDPLRFELAVSEEILHELEQNEFSALGMLHAAEEEVLHEEEEESEWIEPQKHDQHLSYLPESMRIHNIDAIAALKMPQPVVTAKTEPVEKSINTPKELNDALSTRQKELSEVLKAPKINDLRKGISINDRYQYIQNMFRGDEQLFERSIKTLNAFKILPEAQYWMQRELVVRLGWNDEDELVQQFYALISRRFC